MRDNDLHLAAMMRPALSLEGVSAMADASVVPSGRAASASTFVPPEDYAVGAHSPRHQPIAEDAHYEGDCPVAAVLRGLPRRRPSCAQK